MAGFSRISIRNYRAIRELDLDLGPITCLFGPNGAGKTTLLDAIALPHHFVIGGLETAFGLHGDVSAIGAPNGAGASVAVISGDGVGRYELGVRTPPFGAGYFVLESLARRDGSPVFVRNGNSVLWGNAQSSGEEWRLPDVNRSALLPARLRDPTDATAVQVSAVLTNIRYYRFVDFSRQQLKHSGSTQAPSGAALHPNGLNLWSVLRNLKLGYDTSKFYDRILELIRRAFPEFREFEYIQSTENVFCRVIEKSMSRPYPVSSAADGLLQMAFFLAALYGDGAVDCTILLDEPDLSLHPWAIFVLAEAIEDATKNWGRQVLLATHSPVLLSQFSEDNLYLMMPKDGRTSIQRLSDMEEPRDLLNQYSAGTLYMTQLLGAQSEEPMVTLEPINE